MHHFKEQWEYTPTEDVRIDVHLNDGVVTIPLSMLVDLIYPLIAERMKRRLSLEFSDTNVQIDGEIIGKLLQG